MAAVLACGPGALLSHRSAAVLHGLLASGGRTIHVTVTRRSALRRAGLTVHRSTTLLASDVTVIRGIPATNVARTLLDIAAVESRRALERACDQAEVLRMLDIARIDELLSRPERRPGAGRLRGVLAAGEVGENLARSELEERFLALCRRARLPGPRVNEWITADGEPLQVDFLWPRSRVAVETDGYRTHRTRQSFVRDRRRDRLLVQEGWRVIRFTWEEVTREPQHVARVLRNLL